MFTLIWTYVTDVVDHSTATPHRETGCPFKAQAMKDELCPFRTLQVPLDPVGLIAPTPHIPTATRANSISQYESIC